MTTFRWIKIGLLSAGLMMFWGCGSQEDHGHENQEVVQDEHEHEHDHEHDHEHEMEEGLTLNQGEKWASDSSTQLRVEKMQKIMSDFETSGSADYAALGNDLQAEINELINGCKMSGPDHDALHLWLHPYMAEVDKLQDADAAEASAKTVSLQLKEYNEFFELK